MKTKIIVICLFLIYFLPLQASLKEEIISNLEKINNLTFNFKQTIDEKTEEGDCTIEYPKKIFCSYNNLNKKIMVSNGKSLVIKNKNINQYYIYSLKRTPLELILDKKITFNQVGHDIGSKYLEDYISMSKDSNELWEELEQEKASSVLLKNKNDVNQYKSFDQYLNEYLSN